MKINIRPYVKFTFWVLFSIQTALAQNDSTVMVFNWNKIDSVCKKVDSDCIGQEPKVKKSKSRRDRSEIRILFDIINDIFQFHVANETVLKIVCDSIYGDKIKSEIYSKDGKKNIGFWFDKRGHFDIHMGIDFDIRKIIITMEHAFWKKQKCTYYNLINFEYLKALLEKFPYKISKIFFDEVYFEIYF